MFWCEMIALSELMTIPTLLTDFSEMKNNAWKSVILDVVTYIVQMNWIPDNNLVNFSSCSIVFVRIFLRRNGLEIDSEFEDL